MRSPVRTWSPPPKFYVVKFWWDSPVSSSPMTDEANGPQYTFLEVKFFDNWILVDEPRWKFNSIRGKFRRYYFYQRDEEEQVKNLKQSVVKLQRAQGECLGREFRWRTWLPAISFGELEASFNPKISEWDNLLRFKPEYPDVTSGGYTQGTETS